MKLDAVPITPRAKKSANPVRAKAYGMRDLEVTLRYCLTNNSKTRVARELR
jgi:hypothetical protein